jgi:ribosomal-protein-alanine N-acetyltransferase
LDWFLRLAESAPNLMGLSILAQERSLMELSPPILETQRLLIRSANRDDATAILNYYLENKKFLAPFEPVRSAEFYTLKFWQEQIQMNQLEFNSDQAIQFCLFEKNDPERVIGKINVQQIQRRAAQSCILGYSLAETEQGNGYMTEALERVIDYLFRPQNFHRITANYMPRNQRSANVLKRLGFVVEGYARDYLLINGRWEDHILTSLNNPHWRSECTQSEQKLRTKTTSDTQI